MLLYKHKILIHKIRKGELMKTNSTQYFRLRAFPNLEDHYEDFIKHNFVALGWPNTGNLMGKSKEEIRAALEKMYQFKNNRALGLAVGFFMRLLSMKKGDIIVIPHDNKTITFFEVTSTYIYDETFRDNHMAHQVKTKFLKKISVSDISLTFKKSIDTMATLTSLNKYADVIEDILNEKKTKKIGIPTNTFFSDSHSKKIILTISENVDRNDLEMFIDTLHI